VPAVPRSGSAANVSTDRCGDGTAHLPDQGRWLRARSWSTPGPRRLSARDTSHHLPNRPFGAGNTALEFRSESACKAHRPWTVDRRPTTTGQACAAL
jgi:hypothetical protein